MSKRIVSYAYFSHPASVYQKIKGVAGLQFSQFLPMLVRAHHVVWPEWELRIYHDNAVTRLPYWREMKNLKAQNWLTLNNMGEARTLCGSMMWRMIPVFEPDVEYVVCRDVDSIPMPKDRRAVEEFIATDSRFAAHVIHDAKAHAGVMGGTLALRCASFREAVKAISLEELVSRGVDINWDVHGADQQLLNQLSPLFLNRTMLHELNHDTGLPAFKTTRVIQGEWQKPADDLCFLGGCTEPEPAFKYYDSLDLVVNHTIRECEK